MRRKTKERKDKEGKEVYEEEDEGRDSLRREGARRCMRMKMKEGIGERGKERRRCMGRKMKEGKGKGRKEGGREGVA